MIEGRNVVFDRLLKRYHQLTWEIRGEKEGSPARVPAGVERSIKERWSRILRVN